MNWRTRKILAFILAGIMIFSNIAYASSDVEGGLDSVQTETEAVEMDIADGTADEPSGDKNDLAETAEVADAPWEAAEETPSQPDAEKTEQPEATDVLPTEESGITEETSEENESENEQPVTDVIPDESNGLSEEENEYPQDETVPEQAPEKENMADTSEEKEEPAEEEPVKTEEEKPAEAEEQELFDPVKSRPRLNSRNQLSNDSQGNETPAVYTVSVRFEYEDGTVISERKEEYEEGAAYSVSIDAIPGYTAYAEGEKLTGTLEGTADSDKEITVVYKPDEVSYSVKHIYEQIDGTFREEETENLTGKIGDVTEAEARQKTGYTSDMVNNVILVPGMSDSTIEITYKLNEYTVAFNTDGGSYMSTLYKKYGDTVELERMIPHKPGYKFEGWYADVSFGGGPLSSETVTENTVFYAKWSKGQVNYTVVYWKENADDEEYSFDSLEVKSAEVGTEILFDGTSVKEFEHFEFERADQTSVIVDGSGTTTVNVFYSRNEYTLTFKDWRYEFPKFQFIEVERITAKYDSDIRDIWPIEGYEGEAWTADRVFGARVASLDRMPGADITFDNKNQDNLYTKQAEIYYYLEVSEQGEDTVLYDDKYFELYKTVKHRFKLLTKNEEFYTIDGYEQYKSSPEFNNQDRIDLKREQSVSLYYTKKTYSIQFVDSGTSEEKLVAHGASIAGLKDYQPENAKPYLEFDGWYTEGGEQFVFDTMPAKNLILYARWSPKTLTVTFENDGVKNTIPVCGGEKVTVPEDPQKEGYRFLGWYTGGGAKYDFGETVTDDLTLKARWEKITGTRYTVKHIGSDGAELGSFTYNGVIGKTISVPAKTYTGYIPDQSEKSITLKTNPEENVVTFTYTKRDEAKKISYTVYYLEIGTATELRPPESKTAGEGVTRVLAYAKPIEGYQADAGSKSCQLALSSENRITFYYTANTYTATINYVDEKGDTLGSCTETLTYGKSYDLSSQVSKKIDGYVKVAETGDVTGTAKGDITITVTYSKDQDRDNIPDNCQKIVTFKVENGQWNDGTSADVTRKVALKKDGAYAADGSYTITPSDIPEVGNQPSKGYQAGSWKEAPLDAEVKEDRTFTYIYADDPGVTEETSYTVEYYRQDENGPEKIEADSYTRTATAWVNDPDPKIEIQETIDASENKYAGYKLLNTSPENLPAKGDRVKNGTIIKIYYVKDGTQVTELSYTVKYYQDNKIVTADTQTVTEKVWVNSGIATLTVKKDEINLTDKYVGYVLDTVKTAEIPDEIVNGGVISIYYISDENGDHIGDKYQIKITYAAGANGSISGDLEEFINRPEEEGGAVQPEANVTVLPDEGYHFTDWTLENGTSFKNAEEIRNARFTENTVITANFEADEEEPENPENPGGPEEPKGPEEPGNPEGPENPGGPEEPENPEGPETPEESETEGDTGTETGGGTGTTPGTGDPAGAETGMTTNVPTPATPVAAAAPAALAAVPPAQEPAENELTTAEDENVPLAGYNLDEVKDTKDKVQLEDEDVPLAGAMPESVQETVQKCVVHFWLLLLAVMVEAYNLYDKRKRRQHVESLNRDLEKFL